MVQRHGPVTSSAKRCVCKIGLTGAVTLSVYAKLGGGSPGAERAQKARALSSADSEPDVSEDEHVADPSEEEQPCVFDVSLVGIGGGGSSVRASPPGID